MDGFQKRTLKKRKAIMDAAFVLFNEHGYKNVTIAHIAKAAHVSIETIYHYFESKENLKKDLLNQIIDDFCSLNEDILKSDFPVETKFEKLLLAKVEFGQQFSPQFLKEELCELNELDLFGGEKRRGFLRRIMLQIIEQGKRGGIITVESTDEALMTYIEVFQYYISNNFASALEISKNTDLLKEINCLFFNGLKAK